MQMNFEEFKRFLLDNQQLWAPEGIEARPVIRDVTNSNTSYVGLSFAPDPKSGRVTPVADLSALYQRYIKGESISEICRLIRKEFSDTKRAGAIEQIIAPMIDDYEKAKEYLILRPLNITHSGSYIADAVYTTIGDIAFTATICATYGDGDFFVTVPKQMLHKWEVTEETVLCDAIRSMAENDPPEYFDMNKLLPGQDPEEMMLVITNKSMQYGAAVILIPGLLQELAKDIGDLYLLPSSIHDVLAIPVKKTKDMGHTERTLKCMIRDINSSDVISEEDYLSNQLMYYNADRDEITVV